MVRRYGRRHPPPPRPQMDCWVLTYMRITVVFLELLGGVRELREPGRMFNIPDIYIYIIQNQICADTYKKTKITNQL
jgi:hypothetical protein